MPGFNFLPSVTNVKIYKTADNEQKEAFANTIDVTHNVNDISRLGIQLTLSGLNYIKEPIFNSSVSFYLNIVSYTNVNTTDISIISTNSELFDGKRMSLDSEEVDIIIADLKKDLIESLEYDYINNFLMVDVFCTENHLINAEDFKQEIQSPDRYNVIFKTKIPLVKI